jgi:hypothetical protein
MEFLTELWLPILLSAVFVFVVSSVLHMFLPIHKGDYAELPGESEVLEAMRRQNVPPGDYVFPYARSMKELGSPEMLEKYRQGPVGFLHVRPSGPPAMGASLVQWFLYSLLVSALVAYVARAALAPGAHYLEVFQIAGAVATIAYGLSSFSDSIWKGVKWSTTCKFLFDGVIYGLVTAGAFGWLWPAAGA